MSGQSRQKRKLEPITLDELANTAGMSGFVSFLTRDPNTPVPVLDQYLRDHAAKPLSDRDLNRTPQDNLTVDVNLTAKDKLSVEDNMASPDTLPVRRDPATELGRATHVKLSPPDSLEVAPGPPIPPPVKLTPPVNLKSTPVTYETLDGISIDHRFVSRFETVQAAHTSAEQLVYTTMWKLLGTRDDDGDSREGILSIGQIADKVAISARNLRRIMRSLEQKLAIEVTAFEDANRAIPRRYRVWGFRATMERRRRTGYAYVYRNRNLITLARVYPQVNLTPPDTLTGGPPDSLTGQDNLAGRDKLAPAPPDNLGAQPPVNLSASINNSGVSNKTSSKQVPALIANAIVNAFGFIDDDALYQIVRKCRDIVPDATDEEIAELGAHQARRIARMRNLDNRIGLLISQVPKCFIGEPFARYRRETTEEVRRLEEAIQGK